MIYMTSGRPGSGMTLLGTPPVEYVARPAKVQAYADTNGLPPVPSTPPVENSNPSGASEGADGQGVCTIDTQGLGETWLPAYVQELRELDLASKLHSSAHRRKVKDTLSYAGLCVLAQGQVRDTVYRIRNFGGLLLIGGVQ